MPFRCSLMLLLIGALGVSPLLAAPPGDHANIAPLVRPFLEDHCTECHESPHPKAGLDLTALSGNLADRTALDTWIKIYDKTSTGQMPPAKRPRPEPQALAAFTTSLNAALYDASRRSQQTDGRVVLRRLNRVEFQNTLRELLGVYVPMHDDLPPDGVADGFDNVAAGNDVSGSHMVSYMNVIDASLALAIERKKNQTVHQHELAGPYARDRWGASVGKDVTIVGDAAIIYSNRPDHRTFRTFRAETPGRYRLRIAAAAVNSDAPLVLAIHHQLAAHTVPSHVVDFRDIPPGAPRIITFDIDLDEHESLSFFASHLPLSDAFIKAQGDAPLDQTKAPGIKVDWFDFEGPLGETWPTRSHRLLFGDLPVVTGRIREAIRKHRDWPAIGDDEPAEAYSPDPAADADRLLLAFAQRAFRRPVPRDEIAPLLDIVRDRLAQGYEFNDAMRLGFKAILCSPQCLYLLEMPGKLDDFALASRLSYFLWSAMPDDELLRLAAAGKLHDPDVLDAQVDRLLADPRAETFTQNFVGQWLNLRDFDATTPDAKLYPEFDDELHWSMPRETFGFFDHLLHHDLSVVNFVRSDFLFINERLARHYQIDGVSGMELRAVPNPPSSHRQGLMTQAAILKVTANGTVTSPVQRGKFLLDNLLGTPPNPPPPSVGAIDPDTRGSTTIRQQLDKHRADPSCAACHRTIDPPGFALEAYDVIGGFRTWYRASDKTDAGRAEVYPGGPRAWKGPPVDAAGVTPDGKPFDGYDELSNLLMADREQVVRAITERLITYATGAGVQFADREVIDRIVADADKHDDRLRTLIHQIVRSRMFLEK
ncbi:MAG: DUF1592 domain-containing protein [Planctomycetes bacterium]|nr:DUF1592 domain-containing protein [Planctomycetota bacterium]